MDGEGLGVRDAPVFPGREVRDVPTVVPAAGGWVAGATALAPVAVGGAGPSLTDDVLPVVLGETTAIIGEPWPPFVGVPGSELVTWEAGEGRIERTVLDATTTNTVAGTKTPTTNAAVIEGEGRGMGRAMQA